MKKTTVKAFTQPQIERVAARIVGMDWQNKRLYGDFMAQTYYHICYSTRLLAAAAARFTVEQEHLHQQCMKHAGEERSHEKLSLSDLKTIGFTLADFSELPATKAMYRSNYYLIEHVSPLSLFGYAYFLEWVAVRAGSQMLAGVEKLYGANAVKHIHVHTKEDPEHIEVYEKQLDTYSGKDRAVLEEAIETTAFGFERIFEEIQARSGAVARKKAA